ncbi:priB, partial [Ophiophagus hannah]
MWSETQDRELTMNYTVERTFELFAILCSDNREGKSAYFNWEGRHQPDGTCGQKTGEEATVKISVITPTWCVLYLTDAFFSSSWKEGRKKGKKEGRVEGRQEDRKEGRREERKKRKEGRKEKEMREKREGGEKEGEGRKGGRKEKEMREKRREGGEKGGAILPLQDEGATTEKALLLHPTRRTSLRKGTPKIPRLPALMCQVDITGGEKNCFSNNLVPNHQPMQFPQFAHDTRANLGLHKNHVSHTLHVEPAEASGSISRAAHLEHM